jgi:glycerophosphoryl diester phosphodiesterase
MYVANFETESGFDKLYVGGVQYSGSTNPGVLTPATISWTSDYSIVSSGWKICEGCRCGATHSYCYKDNGYCYYGISSSSYDYTCAGKCTNSYVTEYKNFFNIAHMTNRISEVDWAITDGANAVEIDVAYDDDGNNGAKPEWSWHGYACDCSCAIGASGGVCWQMSSNCDRWEYIDTMFEHIATTDLELVHLDNKVTEDYVGHNFVKKLDATKKTEAGKRIAQKVIDKLFKKGFGGRVLIGGQSSKNFLDGAKEIIDSNGYHERVYYSVDGDDKANAVGYGISKPILDKLNTPNIAFVYGISTCSGKENSNYIPDLNQAATDEVPIVIGWTIDYQSTAIRYIDAGVNGIITNFPGTIKSAASSKGLLAR